MNDGEPFVAIINALSIAYGKSNDAMKIIFYPTAQETVSWLTFNP